MKRSVAYLSYFVIVFNFTGIISESYDNPGATEIPASSGDVQENQQIQQSDHQGNLNVDVENKEDNQQQTPKSFFDFSINPASNELQHKFYTHNGCRGLPKCLSFLPNQSKYHTVKNEDVQKYVYPWSKLFYPDFESALPPSSGFDFDYDTVIDTVDDTSNIFDYPAGGEDPTITAYPTRRQRSDEDILKQLEHDAIIHNILPTMDEPFFREADVYSTQGLPKMPNPGHIIAYFPKTYGPPLLLYFGCKPNL